MTPKIALSIRRDDGRDVEISGAHSTLGVMITCCDGELVVGKLLVECIWSATGDTPELRMSAAGKYFFGNIFAQGVPCWPPVPMQTTPPTE